MNPGVTPNGIKRAPATHDRGHRTDQRREEKPVAHRGVVLTVTVYIFS
jgi:hypothetical protein